MNREGIHVFLQELKRETFDKYDIMTVGEANGVSADDVELWVGEGQGTFNMIFQFEHLGLWQKTADGSADIPALKKTLTRWQKGLEGVGWNALFLENHDQPRSVSTWGDDQVFGSSRPKRSRRCIFSCRGRLSSTRGRRSE